ncbi:MAG: hypothetical protein J0M15_10280 [Deltaproteobacteria bacterium]|nr:hypothetical protein [Deltaproteobacteria bacterium]
MKTNEIAIFLNLSKKINSPRKVQQFLKTFNYNKKDTLRSAISCLQKKEAHCMEAAMLAAAILEPLGYPPLVLSFESQDELDHVLFIFKEKGKWGSIGKSRDTGLHGRAPQYSSLRSLAMSYFDPYIDKTGKITAFQMAHLDNTKSDWRFSRRNVWKAERYLLELKHIKLKPQPTRYKKVKAQYIKNGPLKYGKNWW